MVRKCKCSGGCCGPQTDEVSRRGFLTVVGAGAATATVAAQAWADWLQTHTSPEELVLEEGPHAAHLPDRLSLRP